MIFQRKRKLGSSLLILGTGSGDVLALDVSAGQMKWRVSDCHPGCVSCFSVVLLWFLQLFKGNSLLSCFTYPTPNLLSEKGLLRASQLSEFRSLVPKFVVG